jgi:CheY-like chemotaxis protein
MLTGRRVLVVEDEYFIAQDLRTALEARGAGVVGPAPDAESALTLLGQSPVDIAVLDIHLAGAIDFTVADELDRRGIPFVFATGYEAATVPERHREVPLWRKPFESRELAASLCKTMD